MLHDGGLLNRVHRINGEGEAIRGSISAMSLLSDSGIEGNCFAWGKAGQRELIGRIRRSAVAFGVSLFWGNCPLLWIGCFPVLTLVNGRAGRLEGYIIQVVGGGSWGRNRKNWPVSVAEQGRTGENNNPGLA